MTLTSDLLKGKIALITGCSRGIGHASAEAFAASGAIVYANWRHNEMGEGAQYADYLHQKYGATVNILTYDVTDETASKKAIMQIVKEQGRIDLLVNNAGIMEDALVGMISHNLMLKIFETNVFATMNHLQLCARIMKKHGSGSIVNLASIVGVNGNAGQSVYAASKGAVIALTKTAAKELAEYGIRVNALAPGMIDTDMYRSIGEERMHEQLKQIKFGRLGTPEEVANAAVLLSSDLASYISGQILGVDGCAIV